MRFLFKSKHKDKLPGGKADKKKPKDFDKQALAEGVKVEREHTKDPNLAQEIAMDHLTEDPKYYKKLKQVEKAEDIAEILDEIFGKRLAAALGKPFKPLKKATPIAVRMQRLLDRRPDLREKFERGDGVDRSGIAYSLAMDAYGEELEEMEVRKAIGQYIGPLSTADVHLASWNEFFREGGSLNQPSWLQTDRLKQLRQQFGLMARMHQKV